MIRFTALQYRVQGLVALIAIAIAAVALGITGPHLLHLYYTLVANCSSHGDCSSAGSNFLNIDRGLQIGLDVLAVVVPGIVGIFWGAPLVARELETRTFRLAWTQSVTRSRWTVGKIACVGLASMATAGLVSLMVTWWSSPVDRVNMNVFTTFDQRDIVPIGYAAFAFALGVLAGVLMRRTLPAMASTLALFTFVRIAFDHWIRPNLFTPLRAALPLGQNTISGFGSQNGSAPNLFAGSPNIPNAWVYSTQIVDKTGNPLTSQYLAKACPALISNFGGNGPPSPGKGAGPVPSPFGAKSALQECVMKLSATFHEVTSYQPGSRYWPLQWYELGIYLAAALILTGLSVWWVKKRLS